MLLRRGSERSRLPKDRHKHGEDAWLACASSVAILNKRGIWATHELGDHGFPDLVLAHPSGRVIFAELKSDKGKVSPLQSRWLSVLELGAVVWVWRPADLVWIASYLRQPILKTT